MQVDYAETIIEFFGEYPSAFFYLKHCDSEIEISLSLKNGNKIQSPKRCVINRKTERWIISKN
jgi:hypothetical protein